MNMLRNCAVAGLLAASLAAGALSAADPVLLGLVMPDAKFVAGVQLAQAKNSPFGAFVLNQIKSDDEGLQKLLTATGFDPRTDLAEVVVASASDQLRPGNGLAVARGRFDVSRILAAGKAEGGMVTNYLDVPVLTSNEGHHPAWVAFLDSSTALAGDPDSVRAAVDRRKKGGSGLANPLAAKAMDLSSRYDAWVVSTIGLARLSAGVADPNLSGAMRGNVLQAIQQASGGVRFGSIVQVAGEAIMRSDRDATSLVDVIRFLADMALGSNSGPQQVADLVNAIQLSSEANVVKMSLSIPEDQFERLLKGSSAHARIRR